MNTRSATMSFHGLSVVALVLISVFCTGTSSAADIALIAGFDSSSAYEWHAQLDPVMGGNSRGTFSTVTLHYASLVTF